jgi:SSS family solute:Na+ symporter
VTASVNAILGTINSNQMQTQMTVVVTLRHLLPIGLLGLMAAAFIGAAFSTDGAYLHSWGSIFIQDVVMPFRKKPLAADQHLKWLRCSIIGVAVFAWFFSMIFPLKEYIFMFFQISGAIYLGGAGSVIIGGLYWKRGTTAGAWAGMIVGSSLALLSLLLKNVLWSALPYLTSTFTSLSFLKGLPKDIPFNGMQLTFFSSMAAVLAYIVVSLLTKPAPDFDMDKILHRGKYALQGDHTVISKQNTAWHNLFGVSNEFTKGDKIIFFASTCLPLLWFTVFVVGSILYKIFKFSNVVWSKWWLVQICIIFSFAFCTAIWFIWGGFHDLKNFFTSLKMTKINMDKQIDNGKAAEKANDLLGR